MSSFILCACPCGGLTRNSNTYNSFAIRGAARRTTASRRTDSRTAQRRGRGSPESSLGRRLERWICRSSSASDVCNTTDTVYYIVLVLLQVVTTSVKSRYYINRITMYIIDKYDEKVVVDNDEQLLSSE
eukprot:6186847-Pleurochrysis_carterae.AAC.1